MANISVVIIDPTKTRRQKAQLPDDVPMKQLLPALVTKMQLPTTDTQGQPQSYKLNHVSSGDMFGEDETLGDKNVQDDDELKMSVEITPGGKDEN